MSMFNVIEGQIQLAGIGLCATKLLSVVPEDGFEGQAFLLVKGQDIIV